MPDRFDEIRAERDVRLPSRSVRECGQFSGLWKHIALGIVVGYVALGLLGLAVWAVVGMLATAHLSIALP